MSELRFKNAERLSHAYIISAQSQEESLRTANIIAAAAVCSGAGDVPCGICRHCRKVQSGIHPDISLIERLSDDKGKLKKDITVDQIRQMSADAYVLPNEAERKVYIIKEAGLMNPSAQNAALKLFEEPPKGVIFLLCVMNPGQLLTTVRSRCAEINCGGERDDNEGQMKLAEEYLKTVATGDRASLFRWCTANESMDGRTAAAFAGCVQELIADMLCARRGDEGMDSRQLLKLSALMDKCLSYMKVNVGVKHIFGLLAVDSIAYDGNRG